MNHRDPNFLAVKTANPQTLEFQVARTFLLSGLLKTIRRNRSYSLTGYESMVCNHTNVIDDTEY
jgi:phenylalanyl-tRNA synthetase beta subunit